MSLSSRPISVHKFGGAALADAASITNVGQLLASDDSGSQRVVVTSALQGVTNELVRALELATAAAPAQAPGSAVSSMTGVSDGRTSRAEISALVEAIRTRHLAVARALFAAHAPTLDAVTALVDYASDTLGTQLAALAGAAPGPSAATDVVLAFGERVAAQFVAAMLSMRGIESTVVDATALVQTDGRHGNAAPDLTRTETTTRHALAPWLARDVLVVVPGFIGAGHDGSVVTLGRGGSDLTAAVLARALDAREVTLWKDVPGCMSADPRLVPEARVIPVLDAREASELAYYGAKILHPRTLGPLRAGTTLRLRPFADPTAAGTAIVIGRMGKGTPVRAVSGMTDQAMIAVTGAGMLGVPGIAARVFGALAAAHVSVSMISQASSEQSICFTIPSSRADEVQAVLQRCFADELARREIDDIAAQTGLTTVAVVGSGMARTPGIAARIFDAVAAAGVNVVAIAQGASERNVSFLVASAEAPAAIRAVHAAFRLDKVGGGRVVRRTESTDVILLGMGRVGREFIAQFHALARRGGAPMRIVGVIDRRGFVFDPRGITERRLTTLALRKQNGRALDVASGARAGSARDAVAFMAGHALTKPVLVDVASGDTSDALVLAASHGMSLVLANKVPLAAELSVARQVLHGGRAAGGRVLYEATVGAGLPVIDTLRQLLSSGDRVDGIDCSPSGTMGFLFSELGRGRRFSDVVREAMALGYTEPDPRDDLCGLDVARKGLILSRMLGYTGEMSDVSLESLVPDALRDVSPEAFLAALPDSDAEWEGRVADAKARGEVLRYRVRATRGGVRVGLASVPLGSALASLDGTDNLFVFSTARYRDRPLVVSGPGAGTVVTAAGVLGDVLRMVSA